ncbi:hypothetical protein PPTG_05657 [Phytophthora nicotianae INRA-310]|uniref:Uncharacterized protein n=1 Tax=Phytophthora nicotianae (strain INRA-310) TaxID=761204 RepID=W2QU21_PHYN3|nr:hypothetical protein PPTG_05657 [Phytophthora nicotianae INRA-310]ETN16451.1 hypothetical protein PPTG_05657 [Phytophthora nicotianae INRA-310]
MALVHLASYCPPLMPLYISWTKCYDMQRMVTAAQQRNSDEDEGACRGAKTEKTRRMDAFEIPRFGVFFLTWTCLEEPGRSNLA